MVLQLLHMFMWCVYVTKRSRPEGFDANLFLGVRRFSFDYVKSHHVDLEEERRFSSVGIVENSRSFVTAYLSFFFAALKKYQEPWFAKTILTCERRSMLYNFRNVPEYEATQSGKNLIDPPHLKQ